MPIFLARELPKVEYKHVVGLVGLKLFVVPMIFLLYFYLALAYAFGGVGLRCMC
jgi:hypothetical protein